MKKCKCVFLVMGLLACFSGIRAQTIDRYFVEMPVGLMPTVKLDTKKDLIDFFKNGKPAVMPAAFGGKVVLRELSEDYLLIQTSDNANMQLKLLQVNDTLRILAMVSTVAAPLKDSQIQFYSTLWKPLGNMNFPTFTFLDFIDQEKGKSLGLANRLNEISMRNFVSYKFNQHSSSVTVRSSIRQDIRSEIRKDFEPILKDSLILDWNKGQHLFEYNHYSIPVPK